MWEINPPQLKEPLAISRGAPAGIKRYDLVFSHHLPEIKSRRLLYRSAVPTYQHIPCYQYEHCRTPNLLLVLLLAHGTLFNLS